MSKYEVVSKNPKVYFIIDDKITDGKVIDCDFDKRVWVESKDVANFYLKWCYVYTSYEDAFLHLNFDWENGDYEKLPRCLNPWQELLSNKDYSNLIKFRRKEKIAQTSWYVAVDDENYFNSKHFKTQKKALEYFSNLDEYKIKYACLGEENTNQILAEFENYEVWIIEHESKLNFKGCKNRTLKSRHLGKTLTYKDWRK